MIRPSALFSPILLLVLVALAMPTESFAGAWTAREGQSYQRIALNYFFSDENYDLAGDRKDLPLGGEFSDTNLSYYIEYGLSERTTLVSSLYFKYLQREDDLRKDETWGIGDVELGLRQGVWEGAGGAFSVQALVKVPEAYDDEEEVPLGDGVYAAELRLLYGQSLWRLFPGYCNFEAAYRWREGSAAGQIRYLAEIGSSFGEKLYGRVKLDGTEGMDDDNDVLDPLGNPAATTDYDLGKLDLTLGYGIDSHWGVEAAVTPTIYGENTAAGTTYTLALTYSSGD